jgi:hypothetical protein
MYHSTAVLLADGSLLVSGSNPNKDVTTAQWGTSYVVEKWYPKWYNSARPTVKNGYPTSLSYGGDSFNITYTPVDKTSDPSNAKVVIIRSGFSTHGVSYLVSTLLGCEADSGADELWSAIPRARDFVHQG